MGLDAIPTTDLFDAFTKTLCVGYDNVTLVGSFIGSRLGTCGTPISSLLVDLIRLNKSTRRLLMGVPQVPNLLPMKLPTRVTLSYPTHKVFVKASKRSVVGMASKPTSRVAEPSKAYWSPPRTMTLWSTKVVPSTGPMW